MMVAPNSKQQSLKGENGGSIEQNEVLYESSIIESRLHNVYKEDNNEAIIQ